MLKVFLAEDEVIIREALRDSIPWEQHGFIFAGEASDGEMALEMVRTLKPDVVITDIRMPFMDGLTFSRYVSEELPDTKIIIISGYDDFEYARQAVELHADRFLLKPVTKADMISTLEDTRRRIEAERAKRLQDLQKLQSAEDPFSSLELTGFDPMVLNPCCLKTTCWSVFASALPMHCRVPTSRRTLLPSWCRICRWIIPVRS